MHNQFNLLDIKILASLREINPVFDGSLTIGLTVEVTDIAQQLNYGGQIAVNPIKMLI